MYRLARALAVTPLLAGCVTGGTPNNDGPPNTNDPACQIGVEGERVPGYPYDLSAFANDVLPVLTTNCAAAGCHGAPAGAGGYTIWAEAAVGNCDYAKTFNTLARFIDLNNPGNSRVVVAINGGLATHPIKYDAGDARLGALTAYIADASATNSGGGGGGVTPPPGASPFDYDVFQATIQPILDTAEGIGCAGVGCHGNGAGNFTLVANPAAGSQDMLDNFLAVTARTSLQSPAASLVYLKATTRHSGSTVISLQQNGAMLAWIQAAADANGGQDPSACASPDLFNLGVFRDEIYPVLAGDVDLNNAGGGGTTTGCVRGPCHGTDRGPGTLFLSDQISPAQNLQNFACFVDLAAPSRSQILTCPSDIDCATGRHPGQDVFQGGQDFNYKRVLAFLYGSNVNRQPLDYAFFIRQINPIFNDLQAVEGGAQGRTCADAISCHGVSIAGEPASNGSNFPIFPNVSDDARLSFNFVSTAGFVNFLDANQSSLFLYPTNEIANTRDNPLATGLPHPGGTDFAVDSREALTILKWAAGLRPDNQGFITDWLVAGDYPATQIADLTPIDEVNATPRIFDATGAAQFNNGQWDGLFQDDRDDVTVDLNRAFPRAVNNGRIAYAVAYLTNTNAFDITAQLEIRSPNAVRVYVGDRLVAQSENAENGVVAIADLPAYINNSNSTRVLVKLFQRANDNGLEFSARARDEFGNLLTDITGELVLQLGPGGGI
jgi:hypothetical protein